MAIRGRTLHPGKVRARKGLNHAVVWMSVCLFRGGQVRAGFMKKVLNVDKLGKGGGGGQKFQNFADITLGSHF